MSDKTYLGDGVYAAFDGYSLVLTTENGIRTTNEIMIEPEVYAALVRFAQKHGAPRDAQRKE
jgi:hypothetical protein